MIVALTSLSYGAALLPAFVAHYAALGAERVVVSTLELVPGITDEARALTSASPIPVDVRPASERWQRSRLEAHNKDELRRELRLRASDWYVPADLDEFAAFDRPLPELVAALRSSGCEYAMGTMVDRVATTGELVAYDSARPLAEQYPARVDITRGLLGRDNRKVVLCRGDRAVLSGHHRVADHAIKRWPGEYEIAHYAWTSGRLAAFARRVAVYAQHNTGRVHEPYERLREHLAANGGRFDLAALRATSAV